MAVFTFNDIPTLRDDDLRDLLQGLDFYTLVDALAAADGPVREKVFGNVSKRRVARLKTALEKAGGLSREAGEKARAEIIKAIKGAKDSRGRSIVAEGFTFPVEKQRGWIERLTDYIAEECTAGRNRFYFENATEDDLRNALKPFVNGRPELARIRSFGVYARVLPVLLEFLEAGNIEEIDIYHIDRVDYWPLLEKFGGLKKLRIFYAESIPESVGNLQSLTHLEVKDMDGRTIVLPESVGGLKNLTHLSLWNWKGGLMVLPESIGDLKKLTSLHIGKELERLPEGIVKLQSLTEFSLREWKNDLGVLSESVGALKNLERLTIIGKGSSGSVDWIGGLRSLTQLTLWNCGITSLPDEIGKLEKLSELDICDSSIERLPESLADLNALTKLSLVGGGNPHYRNSSRYHDHRYYRGDNKNLKALPEGIGKLENLQELSILDFHLLERVPESLGDLRNLTSLAISGSRSLTRLPESMGKLQSLTSLWLADNENLEALPDGIGKLKKLERLDVSYSSRLDRLPDGIAEIASLESVNLFRSGIRSVPQAISSLKDFTGGAPLAIIPQEASVSHRSFVSHYFKMIETLIRFSKKARREGLLALEDVIKDLEGDLFKRGLRLIVDGAEAEVVRKILGAETEREHDHYRKKLMEIATEGVIGIRNGYETFRLVLPLNNMVDIMDNPIDAAFKKYRAGDRDAFSAIDFAAAIKPEGEREEISFIKKAWKMSELASREGFLALENHIVADAEHDVFEHGLCLLVDHVYHDYGAEREYIASVLGKMVRRKTDPVRKNIAAAKREAILSIYDSEIPRIMAIKLLAYFDKSVAEAAADAIQKD